MLEFATPFHGQLSKLKSPTGRGFNPDDWKAAFESEKNLTDSDRMLVIAAYWFAAQSAARRGSISDSEFESLGAAETAILAVAIANREFIVTNVLSNDTMKQAQRDGAIAFGHIAERPMIGTIQSITAGEASEAAVDAIESRLFDANSKTAGNQGPSDLGPLALRAMKHYCTQRGLNDMWNQVLWEGWKLLSHDDELILSPADLPLATKLYAASIRHQENFMNLPFIDMHAWFAMDSQQRRQFALPRTVTEVSTEGRRKIRVGRPSYRSKKPPMFILERAGLEGSYLKFFLDEQFPNDARLTVRFLLQAWAVVSDLARELTKSLKLTNRLSLADARKIALIVSKKELTKVISTALASDENTANSLIQFLTYLPRAPNQTGNRGVWSAPLVQIPGEDNFALVCSVLATSNSIRKVEAWLEKGGLNNILSNRKRGKLFEEKYRLEIIAAINKNPLLTTTICAKEAIKKDATCSEEVDLLIKLGKLLIVGEVKCWIYPAESFERFMHFNKMRAAASQANRKADFLRSRPDIAAKALGLPEEEVRKLHIVPIVVSNQGFGFSLEAEGCRITDTAFLRLYLATGTIKTEMLIGSPTVSMMTNDLELYSTEREASDRFEMHCRKPAVLQRFIDRISWTALPFPLPVGGNLRFLAPRLADIDEARKLRISNLVNSFDN